MTSTDYQFLTARITATEALIVAYEDAQLALGTSGIQSYSLDTGQSKQMVTRANLTEINKTVNSLYNRRATLLARRDGSGVVHVGAAW